MVGIKLIVYNSFKDNNIMLLSKHKFISNFANLKKKKNPIATHRIVYLHDHKVLKTELVKGNFVSITW